MEIHNFLIDRFIPYYIMELKTQIFTALLQSDVHIRHKIYGFM